LLRIVSKYLKDRKKVGKILLLTQPEYAPFLSPALVRTGVAHRVVVERPDLDHAIAALDHQTRLVAFATKIIVPTAALKQFSGPCYNFHPGPPEYPGLFPSVYAIYDGRTSFGVTLHEMAAQVDSGPIVDVARFDIPNGLNRISLDNQTFNVMVKMFEQWAPHLANVQTSLSLCGETWSGRRRTRADFNAFCELGENPTDEEFARRLLAAGEGPEHALTLSRFGRRFRLISDPTAAVLRAGLEAMS
jgi:hypothetical protein